MFYVVMQDWKWVRSTTRRGKSDEETYFPNENNNLPCNNALLLNITILLFA